MGTRWEQSGNTKWEQEPQSEARMRTKWEQEPQSGQEWDKVEQSGNKNPKVRQEWEQTRDKVGTRTAKRGRTGNKAGTK